jgi:DNA-binding CsgD family transcriptional regulator
VELFGRERECAVLDGLLSSAREGRSATLVIRGGPGIGKTALIDYAVGAASDFLIVRFTGVESERQLGFAALHRLLTPILHQIERLPAPQRDALNSALGLASGPPANGFLVGLGVISLAATAAKARERLLCVIDDAQWIDSESIEALAFWGRRLNAEGIALIFGERDGVDTASPLGGLPVLEVQGLADDQARALLDSESEVSLDRQVADRAVAHAGGNPLALVELVNGLSADQLLGAATLPELLPVGLLLEEHFSRWVRSLPVETQIFLLLVAADPSGDWALLMRAASVLGVDREAADRAESDGLLTLNPRVAFRHPLIRSAVYSKARPADRRAVHRALAVATDVERDADRRAWHLAGAAVGTDEDVASTLEGCAERAGGRGGHAAQAAFMSRSAELTPDPECAAQRRVVAAGAALAAGSPRQAHTLVALARPDLVDMAARAKGDRIVGRGWMLVGRPGIAAPILLSAAGALLPADPLLGRQTLLEGLEASFLAGSVDAAGPDTATALDIVGRQPGKGGISDRLLDAFAAYVTSGYVTAVPFLRDAIEAIGDEAVPAGQRSRWTALASIAAQALWDQDAHYELMTGLAHLAADQGALGWLCLAWQGCAVSETWAGRFGAAETYFAQAADVNAAAGGHAMPLDMDLILMASQGHDATTRARAGFVLTSAAEQGMGAGAILAHHALMTLDLGQGRYGDALEHASVVFEADPVATGNLVLADMVEAAVRSGDTDAAQRAMGRLGERATASGTDWALGVSARSQALLAGDVGEALYRDAIDLLEPTRLGVESARTHLLYGEWLRRQKRRTDARDELRIAEDMLEAMGAEAFAKRARDELLATGERARKRTVETSNDLTPQETHVAQLAASGDSNPEIAAQLYISVSTVEYHLRKVFRKLSVSSRRQLKGALAHAGVGASMADVDR